MEFNGVFDKNPLLPFFLQSCKIIPGYIWELIGSQCTLHGGGTNNGYRDHVNSDAYLLYSHDLYHHYMWTDWAIFGLVVIEIMSTKSRGDSLRGNRQNHTPNMNIKGPHVSWSTSVQMSSSEIFLWSYKIKAFKYCLWQFISWQYSYCRSKITYTDNQ